MNTIAPIFAPTLTRPQQRALARRTLRRQQRLQRYIGPAYPFGATVGAVLGQKDDVRVVITSMVNILTTPKGSVPYDPLMGSVVPLLVFEILDEITLSLIRYFTYKDLTEQEPRAVIRQVYARQEGDNRVVCEVGWSLVGDPEGNLFGTPVTVTREAIGAL